MSVEEIKALEVGDWVWVINLPMAQGQYAQVEETKQFGRYFSGKFYNVIPIYSDYGKTWLAYKNKEQAESKGDLYQTAFELILQDVYETRLQADVLSCSSCPFMAEIFGECQNQGLYEDCKKRWEEYYLKQAERRLAELKGEEK